MSDLDLEAIKARLEGRTVYPGTDTADVTALVAEVERLREERSCSCPCEICRSCAKQSY